ncbi:MAG TPA: cytochrome c oxidase assembly protein [Candidatus Eisenbacteria bacterium]|nr:cytochrome c oxidase assembly protein [Candidatus Eisenbacteria bacterium]
MPSHGRAITAAAVLLLLLLFSTWEAPPARAHLGASEEFLPGWHWRWDVTSVLVLFGTLYTRGWIRLRKLGGAAGCFHLFSYTVALAAIACALLSPLDGLASYLLIAHMVQHELLIMIAPPLILLANPVPVLLWGLGSRCRSRFGNVMARHSLLRQARDFLGSMPVAWFLYVANLWAWHHPLLYEAALRNSTIHDIEHLLFFLTGLLFWWPVARPASRPAPVHDALRILYLFLAATQDAVLSGLIALSGTVLYPHYEGARRVWGVTPLEDQIGGGIVMFAVGSTVYLVAILLVVNSLLSADRHKRSTKGALRDGAVEIEGRV